MNYKVLTILSLLVSFSLSADINYNDSHCEIKITNRKIIDRHSYLIFDNNQILHDPDCKCHDWNVMESPDGTLRVYKNRSSYISTNKY